LAALKAQLKVFPPIFCFQTHPHSSNAQAPGNLSVGEAVTIGLLGAEGVLFFCAGEIIGRGR
jgi:hypothetical protein